MNKPTIRNSEPGDLPAIRAIYEQEVLTGLATFETTPPDIDELAHRRQQLLDNGFPYLVACIDEQVVGYAYVGPYRARAAYQNSIENSVYVDSKVRNRGVGKLLLVQLIIACENGPWRQMIAVIGNSKNTGSIALHKKLGFRHVGTIEGVGYKLDQWVDTVIMQRSINSGSDTKPDASTEQV